MDQCGDDKFTEEDDDSGSNLDPRIGLKLEELNKWTGKINTLEKSFEEANSRFRITLNESTDRLKLLSTKLGKSIDDSRPYYEAKDRLTEVQAKCQKAAINFEKACQAYLEAKERINLAEKKFNSAAHEFDTTWQEMLNQANIKLMEAETMKKESERLHHNSMKDFHSAEMVVLDLKKKLKGSLHRSKRYFEEKKRFQKQLGSIKEEIESIISQINCSKARYAATLRELEAISEEIHEKRNCSLLKHLKREPGVGAELKPEMRSIEMVNSRLSQLGLQLSQDDYCPKGGETEEEDEDEEEPSSSKSISSQASTSDAMMYPADSCSDIVGSICKHNDDHLQSEKDTDSFNYDEDEDEEEREEDLEFKTKHENFINNRKDILDVQNGVLIESKGSYFCSIDSSVMRKESSSDILNGKSSEKNAFFEVSFS